MTLIGVMVDPSDLDVSCGTNRGEWHSEPVIEGFTVDLEWTGRSARETNVRMASVSLGTGNGSWHETQNEIPAKDLERLHRDYIQSVW